jgi:Uma2 family endonuclease
VFTVRDVDETPDDGNQYELIDGTLLVRRPPGVRHQKAVMRLFFALDAACPVDLEALAGPFAVRPSDTTELRPDVVVARYEDFTDKDLPVAPLLAVEVLSPSSVITDFNNKKAVYERMGVPSYWIVDPIGLVLTVFELDDAGRYQLVGEVAGDKAFEAIQPFPVRIVPADLIKGMKS